MGAAIIARAIHSVGAWIGGEIHDAGVEVANAIEAAGAGAGVSDDMGVRDGGEVSLARAVAEGFHNVAAAIDRHRTA